MGTAFDSGWFASYLDAFAACGRGDSDDYAALLDYYSVPLLLASDDASLALTSREQVLEVLRRQFSAMRAEGYDHSEMLGSQATTINRNCALHTGEFSRRRADGSEIGRFRATYLITTGESGRRVSALALHSP